MGISTNLSENEYLVLVELWINGGKVKSSILSQTLQDKYGKSRATWYTYINRLVKKSLITKSNGFIQVEVCYTDITCDYVDYLFENVLKLGIDKPTIDLLKENFNEHGYELKEIEA